jgi:hypothetical protein
MRSAHSLRPKTSRLAPSAQYVRGGLVNRFLVQMGDDPVVQANHLGGDAAVPALRRLEYSASPLKQECQGEQRRQQSCQKNLAFHGIADLSPFRHLALPLS